MLAITEATIQMALVEVCSNLHAERKGAFNLSIIPLSPVLATSQLIPLSRDSGKLHVAHIIALST